MRLVAFQLIFVFIVCTLIKLHNAQKLPWAYTLYPYGTQFNDTLTARDQEHGSGLIPLPFNISFMGHKFNQIWVQHAGFLSFQPTARFMLNDEWPQPNYPGMDDPIFIAPFYSRIELANDRFVTGEQELEFFKDDNYGRVMYRYIERPSESFVMPEPHVDINQLDPGTRINKQAVELLNMVQGNIRDSVSGAEGFNAQYAFIATWGNVTFLGIREMDLLKRPRNSYQAMIVTDIDANLTFAVFNYEKIEWAASTEYGGDSLTGLSDTKAAKIGFNRGNGTEFFKVLPYSNNPKDILKLHESSNVNYRGRFIYRIDEWIQPAGCKNEFSDGELFVWPRYGNMLGGQEVNITGPCFGYHPNPQSDFFIPFEKTYCRWGDDPDSPETMAEVITVIRARCVMPRIYFNGRINLWVSIDAGRTYKWKAEFSIADPIRCPPKVELVNFDEWFKAVPSTNSLAVKWNRDDLGWSRNETVDVQLFGYYEDEDGPHWDFLQKVGDRVTNNGFYEFLIKENWAVEQNRARRYRMGAVAVALSTGGTIEPKMIWSELQPLGWWRHNEMDIFYDRQSILFGSSRGKTWMEDQCRWWHEYQRWDRFWMYDLERCPCTIAFAVSDVGRWVPDPQCNMDRGYNDPSNCQFHRGAAHCVVFLKPTVSGGGSRCCYDFTGNLMYTNDTKSGSTSDRYHIFGNPPYNTYGSVPALSHYLNDMVPYYLCCEWSDLCDSYLYVRETADCKGHRYTKGAAIYGDPHVLTFDGKEYTVNARGEYRLLISTRHNFRLQGRFERPPNATFCLETSGGQINATALTAIAVKEDGSDTIEIRSRIHPNQTWRFRCDLFVNGKQWWINRTEEKMQFYKNVAILIPHNDMFMSNMTIMFNRSGAGVQVSCNHGMINLKYSAPPVMLYETEGLLGYWNKDKDDEFRLPNGHIIDIDSSPQDIHKKFVAPWRIDQPTNSLFTYSGSLAFNKFHDQKENIHSWMKFVPWYTWDEQGWSFPTYRDGKNILPFSESEMLSACDGDEQCLYDAKAMGDLEIGIATRNAHRYYKYLDEQMKPVNSCGIYPLKGGIRRTTTGNYLSGSRMTVSCQKGYTFYGHPEYICHENGTWLPSNGVPLDKFNDWPVCEHFHITGIKWSSVGLGSLVGLAFILTLIYYLVFQRNPKEKKPLGNKNVPKKPIYNGQSQDDYSKVALNEAVVNYQPDDDGPGEEEYDETTDDNEEYDINEADDDYSRNNLQQNYMNGNVV